MTGRRSFGTYSILGALLIAACGGAGDSGEGSSEAVADRGAHENAVLDLWAAGRTAFGVYVPDERPRSETRESGPRPPAIYTSQGAERLAANPLYDFLFLNLEGSYDVAAVEAMTSGLRSATSVGRKTLLVRIPPISAEGEEVARARVREILALGADGVVLPHIRGVAEAEVAIAFFEEAGADVWSPSNPDGETIAMLMIEDPGALAEASNIAALGGYSVLACGIGSLTRALDGDRVAAEAGNQEILARSREAGLADMITANADNVAQRVDEGFLALLMQGPNADHVIRLGRTAAGRD